MSTSAPPKFPRLTEVSYQGARWPIPVRVLHIINLRRRNMESIYTFVKRIAGEEAKLWSQVRETYRDPLEADCRIRAYQELVIESTVRSLPEKFRIAARTTRPETLDELYELISYKQAENKPAKGEVGEDGGHGERRPEPSPIGEIAPRPLEEHCRIDDLVSFPYLFHPGNGEKPTVRKTYAAVVKGNSTSLKDEDSSDEHELDEESSLEESDDWDSSDSYPSLSGGGRKRQGRKRWTKDCLIKTQRA